jgi:hypothetical protein
MTKSKTFWAVAAIASLAVMAFAGWSIYERLSLHMSGDTIEVRPVPVPADQPEGETVEDTKAPEEAKETETAAPAKEKAEADDGRIKAVKTVFEYKDAKAKSVKLAGSFSRWNSKPMKKGKNGVWKAEEYIFPGTYPYHFIVDGKKKLDPGKPKAPTGDSLVDVN